MSRSSADRKKVLIVQYSQSGQLTRIMQKLSAPLLEAGVIQTKTVNLKPARPFPFPWPLLDFFNIFPECVYLEPVELEPLEIKPEESFDLIIFAYQVWFLSPSLPATAFLKSRAAQPVLKNTPVITVIGCRNMWTQAHLKVKQMLAQLGTRLIDNVVFVDQGSTLASFITTPRWLLTGRKDAFWWFPPAGVAEQEITASDRFGRAIVAGLMADKETSGEPMLSGLGAVTADVALIQSEKIGYRSFRIWGNLLRRIGDQSSLIRKIVLIIYILFLICMILLVVPVTMLVKILLRPFFRRHYQQLKQDFEQPSGSSKERMEEFTCQN